MTGVRACIAVNCPDLSGRLTGSRRGDRRLYASWRPFRIVDPDRRQPSAHACMLLVKAVWNVANGYFRAEDSMKLRPCAVWMVYYRRHRELDDDGLLSSITDRLSRRFSRSAGEMASYRILKIALQQVILWGRIHKSAVTGVPDGEKRRTAIVPPPIRLPRTDSVHLGGKAQAGLPTCSAIP